MKIKSLILLSILFSLVSCGQSSSNGGGGSSKKKSKKVELVEVEQLEGTWRISGTLSEAMEADKGTYHKQDTFIYHEGFPSCTQNDMGTKVIEEYTFAKNESNEDIIKIAQYNFNGSNIEKPKDSELCLVVYVEFTLEFIPKYDLMGFNQMEAFIKITGFTKNTMTIDYKHIYDREGKVIQELE